MQIQAITNLRSHNNYQVKAHNIAKNYSTSPMAVDTFTPSVAFKGIREAQEAIRIDDTKGLRREIENGLDVNRVLDTDDKDPLIEYAGYKGSINCFRELRKHDVNMYAEDRWGYFCFLNACNHGHNEIVQELVNDPEYKINYQNTKYGYTGLMIACFGGKEDTVDIILQRPDVDLKLTNKDGQTAENIARKNGYDSIVKKLQAYVPGVDRRTGVIEKVSNATQQNNNVETEQQIAERVLKTQMDAVKQQQDELAKREEELAQKEDNLEEREQAIAKKEATLETTIKTKAEEITANEKAKLAQERREAQDEKDAYQNLINIEKQLIAEEVINERKALAVGYRVLYRADDADNEELPPNMDFDEQTVYVLNVLAKRQDKLTHTSSETPDKITKAIQDDTGNISLDGLNYLERALDASAEKFSEKDLLDSIKSVKGKYGLFDMKKVAVFISNIAWKDNSVRSVIQKVEKYGLKV